VRSCLPHAGLYLLRNKERRSALARPACMQVRSKRELAVCNRDGKLQAPFRRGATIVVGVDLLYS
jgi:hypothetical protein